MLKLKNVLSNIVISTAVFLTGIIVLSLANSGKAIDLKGLLPKAQAAGIQGVLFVVGNACPDGFSEPAAAGLAADFDDYRFPLLVPDTASAATGAVAGDTQVNNATGGNAAMTVAQMPSHGHSIPATWGGHTHWPGAGGSLNGNGGSTSGGMGSGQNYWPRYTKLKPCIWTLD